MSNSITKVALWEPTEELKRNACKLNRNEYVIAGGYSDQQELCSKNRDYISMDISRVNDFDIVLIPYQNFRDTRNRLEKDFQIPAEKIYTFEEFQVLNCEENIEKKYHSLWDRMHEADINLFEGQTVLIVGGGSGIGKESAVAFQRAGAKVIIAGRNQEKLVEVCDSVENADMKYLQWDITDIVNNPKRLAQAEELFQRQIDIVINCAGIWENKHFFEVTETEFDNIINTNLKGVYFLCQMFGQYFIDRQIKGHIVNVISNTGLLPTVKPYGISKWGMVGFTKGLGLHLAEYGITVNGVAPGSVATKMSGWNRGDCPARRNPKTGRIAFPCEVAQIILGLAGFMGENMPGEIVTFDGGDKNINWFL